MRWAYRWINHGALLAGCVLAAQGVTAATRGSGDFDVTVAPGRFEEVCVSVPAHQKLRYRFEAEASLDFNVHFHRGNDVLYPVKRSAVRRDDGAVSGASAEDYCLMWDNRGALPVRVRGSTRVEP